jgi:hypothetical protein
LSFASGRASRGGVSVTHLHRGGDDPVRVLMVADLGVTAVPLEGPVSHFADVVVDRLWLRMRRGLDVDVLQEPWAALHAIAGSFASWSSSEYDLVVFVVDPPEVLADHEQRGLTAILQSVLMRLVLTTRVVLVALEPEDDAPRHRRATEFSSDLMAAARSPAVRLTMLQIPQGRAGSADAVARHLQIAIGIVAPLALAEIEVAEDFDSPFASSPALSRRLGHITEMARSAFGTDAAALNLADNGRLTTIACEGGDLGVQSLAGSLCDLTIGHDVLVVVSDTAAVPLLRGFRAVRARQPVRFYAGYPISAPGRPGLGALCVYDRAPHERDEFDFTMLRDLALLAEGELAEAGLH